MPAYRDDASITILITFAASHRPPVDLPDESPGGMLPAWPALTFGKTALRALGRIDPVQTHPHGANFYRVAVERLCPAGTDHAGERIADRLSFT